MTEMSTPERGSLAGAIAELRDRLTGEGLTGSAFRSFQVLVGGAAISFVGQVILARVLGQHNYGIYLYALAVLNAVLVLGKLELDGTSTRFLAGYVGAGQWGLARGISNWSRRIVRVSSLIVATAGAAVVLIARERIARKDPQLPAALLAACVMLLANAQLLLNAAHLQALKRFVQSQLPGMVLRPALLAGAIALWPVVASRAPSPTQAILVNVAAALTAVVFTTVWLRRARPAEFDTTPAVYDGPRWSRAARGLVGIGIAQLILSQQADLVVVGSLVGVADSALYGAASQFTMLLQFGQASLSLVAAPLIAELHEQGNYARLQQLVRSVFLANAAIALPILAILVFLGRDLLRLSYGPVYGAAYPVLILLGAAATIAAIVGATSGFLLTMTEYQSEAAWIIGGSALLNLLLALVLTPRYGLIGTATATLVATAARSGVLVWYIRRRMKLSVVPGF